jgi:hypothetical protein
VLLAVSAITGPHAILRLMALMLLAFILLIDRYHHDHDHAIAGAYSGLLFTTLLKVPGPGI